MAVTLSEFLDRLESSGILDAAALESVRSAAGDADGDAEGFVKKLHKSGTITGYQARALWKDKGHKLAFGNYVIEDELGRGGMGVVLKARHKRMQRHVAIKVLPQKMTEDPEAIARFQREVVAASQLEHPNIVGAHDADEINGQHIFVMQFVDGRDLSSIVRKQGPFAVTQAVDCIKQAAAGLAYAHGRGVVHRDIKPANLLLDSEGTVKILDMGLARFDESAEVGTQAELTGTGTVMGTVDYMSPEQALSTKSADARSDQYSLGISLWFLLTGKAAYDGDSLMARLMAHANQPIPSLRDDRPDVPESVQDVFERMVAKNPEDRFADMNEAIAALEAIDVEGTGTVATATAPGSDAEAGSVQLSNGGGAVDPNGATMPPTGAWDDSAPEHEGATHTAVATADESSADMEEPTLVGTPESGTVPVLVPGAAATPSPAKVPSESGSWADHLKDWRVLAGAGGAIVALLIAVFFLVGPDGTTLRVEIDDPEIEVSIKGTTIVLTKADTKPITIEPGEHILKVTRGDFTFDTDKLVLKKGDDVVVKAEVLEGEIRIVKKDGTRIGGIPTDGGAGGDSGSGTGTGTVVAAKPGANNAIAVGGRPSATATFAEPWAPESYTVEAFVNSKSSGHSTMISLGPLFGLTSAPQMWASTGVAATKRNKPRAGVTHHLAFVRDGGKNSLFVDGKLVNAADVPAPAGGATSLVFGGKHCSATFDEIRLSSVARYTEDFVAPKPNEQFTPDEHTFALYHCDEGEGDTVADASGNGNDLKLKDVVWTNVGEAARTLEPAGRPLAERGLVFGSGDTVTLDTLKLDCDTPVTFEAWYSLGEVDVERIYGGRMIGTGVNLNLQHGNPRQGWTGFLRTTNTYKYFQTNSGKLPTGNAPPQHLAYVRDKEELRIYVDGLLRQKAAIDPELLYPLDELPVVIGPIRGTIHEVRITSGARYTEKKFTPEEWLTTDANTLALYHFDEGDGDELRDSSGNGHHGKIEGAKWVRSADPEPVPADKTATGLMFEGSYVSVPTLKVSPSDPVTIESWATGTDGMLFNIVEGPNRKSYDLTLQAVSTEPDGWRAGLKSTAETGNSIWAPSRIQGTAGAAAHVACVRDARELRIYVDGKLRARTPIDPGAEFATDRRNVEFGHRFNGTIHGMRLSRGSRYDADFSPPKRFTADADTLGLYHFNERSGRGVKDASGNGHHGQIVGLPKWVATAPPPAVAPFDAAAAKAHQEAWAKHLGVPVEKTIDLPGGEPMVFVLIPPGEFSMGSHDSEVAAALKQAEQFAKPKISLEAPRHRVHISKPFYLGKFEVTRSQWRAVTGDDPTGGASDKHPAVNVTWAETRAFARTLDEARLPTATGSFGLPTEAMWEYSCRAGTEFSWSMGGDPAELSKVAWFDAHSGVPKVTHRVGELKPNAFGLHDMHGNVCEWCDDALRTYTSDAVTDPRGPKGGRKHVYRGGSYGNVPLECRSAFRAENHQDKGSYLGVRLSMAIEVGGELTSRASPPPAVAPFDAAAAKAHQEAWAKHLGVPVRYENSLGAEFVLVPPGRFWRGSTPAEIAAAPKFPGEDDFWSICTASEAPRHVVVLTKPFYLGVHEVTQAEYEAVTGGNPSSFSPNGDLADRVAGITTARFPVEMVDWGQAVDFCRKLSEREGLKPSRYREPADGKAVVEGNGYRLPTEAEWEFACRAGTETLYWIGNENTDLNRAGWSGANSGDRTHAVGELAANPFGLFDVHGNVWEWVQDGWTKDDYALFAGREATDPLSPMVDNPHRAVRGGFWGTPEARCSSGRRYGSPLHQPYGHIGFRTALSVDAVQQLLAADGAPNPPPPAVAPFDAAKARAHQEAWAKHLGEPGVTTNSIGMKLAVIPAGTFTFAEHDSREVTFEQSYRIGAHEVTRGQWSAVMETEPWRDAAPEGDDVAATFVDWDDAANFCDRLTEIEREAGRLPANMVYRLPSAEEWEYACKAGTETRFSFGDDPSRLGDYGWFKENTTNAGRAHAQPVGGKLPNPWGLYDVHGNVMEWTSTMLAPNPANRAPRVLLCGGFWDTDAPICRSTGRYSKFWHQPGNDTGFRVVLAEVTDPTPPFTPTSPLDGAAALYYQSMWARFLGELVETTNSIGTKLKVVPPGTFRMGEGDAAVEVTLSRPFRLGVHEITRAQWRTVMETEPWSGEEKFSAGDDIAASHVSCRDAEAFCRKLTTLERAGGRLPDDHEYRLPTEAEWEYACRAGTATTFSHGDDASQHGVYAWFDANGKNGGAAHPNKVGAKQPNIWGFHDMHGNVWESCRDSFHESVGGGTDPIAPAGGTDQVVRGGCWNSPASSCGSAFRGRITPDNRLPTQGFRVVLAPVTAK